MFEVGCWGGGSSFQKHLKTGVGKGKSCSWGGGGGEGFEDITTPAFTRYKNIYGIEIHIFCFLDIDSYGNKNVV